MSSCIILLGIILVLQLKCTTQNILDKYSVNKPQISYDSDYTLSAVSTPNLPEDDKYHTEDYAAIASLNSVPGKPGADYPVLDKVPETSFSCEARPEGYYADPETGCQVFHICLTQSVKNSFLCPNGSIFSQELFTCDWWNRVDCQYSENVNKNKNYGQKFIPNKVLSAHGKSKTIVEDIQIGEGKNKNNIEIPKLNASKDSELISTSRPHRVTQSIKNTKFAVIKPVVTTQQTKSNIVESVTSYLVLPTQYKCCNHSKASKLSEPLQIKLLNPEQIKSTTDSMSQYGQFSQSIQDSSALTPVDSLHNFESKVLLGQQKSIPHDSLLFPTFGLLNANQRNSKIGNLQFQNNLQNSVSSTTPEFTFTGRTQEAGYSSLSLDQNFPHFNKLFVGTMSGQDVNLFDNLNGPSTKYLPYTTLQTFDLPQHTTPSMLEQPQLPTLSLTEQPESIPVSASEQKQNTTTTTTTTLKQLQHTTHSTPEMPQSTLASTSKQQQHTNDTIMDLLQHATDGKVEFPLDSSVSTVQLPHQFVYVMQNISQGNLRNKSSYENSTDSYSLQTVSGVSIAKHVQSDISSSVNKCNFVKNCFLHINSSSLDSDGVSTENTDQLNNTLGKRLFILDTIINPFRKENFNKSKSNATEYKQNNTENYRIRTNTDTNTDLYKNKYFHLPPINKASTPVPFRYTETLQHPYTHFAQYETLADSRESKQAVIARPQNTQTLNFKVSDILNLNNLNLVNNQHPLSEVASSSKPTIVKSISFNFDTEEGRKEFDLAVSSGLLSEL